jgi:hypothetical protein
MKVEKKLGQESTVEVVTLALVVLTLREKKMKKVGNYKTSGTLGSFLWACLFAEGDQLFS